MLCFIGSKNKEPLKFEVKTACLYEMNACPSKNIVLKS